MIRGILNSISETVSMFVGKPFEASFDWLENKLYSRAERRQNHKLTTVKRKALNSAKVKRSFKAVSVPMPEAKRKAKKQVAPTTAKTNGTQFNLFSYMKGAEDE